MSPVTDLVAVEVGIATSGPAAAGWRRVLQQEGLPHREVDGPDTPVTVFADALPPWVEGYVARGGVAVVSGAPAADGLLPAPLEALVHGFEPPGSHRPCRAPTLARLFPGPGEGVCRLHEERLVKDGMDPGRFALVHRRRVDRGLLLWTGVPLTRLLMAHGDTLRRFSPHSSVTERVASVDKAVVADTLVGMLETALAAAGLPIVGPARFPDGAPSALVFRVDVDGAFGDRTAALVGAADDHEVPLSIYVNGRLCEEHPGTLDDWSGRHELGQHGWVHNLFDTVEENTANLREGAAWLARRTGVVPSSFVAPRGMWNPALGHALAGLGYGYSADFGLDFDSLPFRVPGSGILQVPVHPYSPERAAVHAREEGLPAPTADGVTAHYLAVLADQVRARRPVHLYGHPEVLGAMAATVLPAVFRAAADRGLPALTLGALADWWQRREAAGTRATWDRASRTLTVTHDLGAAWPTVVRAPVTADVLLAGRRHRVAAGDRALLRPDAHGDLR